MFKIFAGLSHVHFVGIGGAGMSGIAEVLLSYDLRVSGCDQARSETTERLASLGVTFYEGHSADHLDGVDLGHDPRSPREAPAGPDRCSVGVG